MFFVFLYFYVRSFCAFCLLSGFSILWQWPYVCGGSQRRHMYFSTWLFLVSPVFHHFAELGDTRLDVLKNLFYALDCYIVVYS